MGPVLVGFLTILTALALAAWAHAAVFVKADATPGGSGTSWADAYTSIQEGIDNAGAETELWVAAGTYEESLALVSGLAVYGGFAGTEADLSERDAQANETIIDAAGATHAVVMDTLTGARLDGFTITGGNANGASSPDNSGGGVYASGCNNTNTLANLMVRGNSASGSGGGITVINGSPKLTSLVLAGNTAAGSGAGLYLNNSSSEISDCTAVGNAAGSRGGGISLSMCNAISLTNLVAAGNTASSGGGVYIFADSGDSIINATIDGNHASSFGGGLVADSSSPTLENVIFTDNTAHAVYENTTSSDPVMANCLFFNNPDGDYYDEKANSYTGATEISSHLPGTPILVSGDPAYLGEGSGAQGGAWTQGAYFDGANNRTVFTDATASFTPGALAGKYVNPLTSQRRLGLVVGNTATAVYVVGDLSGLVPSGGVNYAFKDWHLEDGSSAIDRGLLDNAPAWDFEGDDRPGGDGLCDIGADEAPDAYAPTPDLTAPVSTVLDLEPCMTTEIFNVDYQAADDASGLAWVKLFYRVDGGLWTQYGEEFSSSPVNFDTSATGTATGDGYYEFYTISADNDGNVEDAPAGADASVLVITSFSGARVYADPLNQGTRTGEGWGTAVDSLGAALILARDFGLAEVWAKAGSYAESISLVSGVGLYGGFAGSETEIGQRDPEANPTIIDASTADNGAPALHAVVIESVTNAAIDGFLITGGQADGSILSDSWGGGLYIKSIDATTTISNLVVAGNTATSGGGIYCKSSVLNLDSVVIAGNTASSGGGFYAESVSGELSNCLFTGNSASQGGGAFLFGSPITITGCTFDANSAGFQGGGLQLSSCNPVVANSIFSDNVRYGISESGTGSDPSVSNCLFYENLSPGGDYLNEGNTSLSGANEINIMVDTANDNVSGDPRFVKDWTSSVGGAWTSAPAYDPATNTTLLTDSSAAFGSLAGELVKVDSAERKAFLILSNTGDQLTVAGDASSLAVNGGSYTMLDYHIEDGSAALDRGLDSESPAKDLDGDARPGSDSLYDIGVDEAVNGDWEPMEDFNKPVSSVSAIPAAMTSVLFDLPYTASDAESGLDFVELYYRRNGGSWTKYGTLFTQSPVSFDTATTGGDGFYEFYTVAYDLAYPVNIEDAPAEADASTLVLNSFTGSKVIVSSSAGASQNGQAWTTPILNLEAAIIVAEAFSVDQVWVGKGVYQAGQGGLALVDSIALYGGFAGNESTLDGRDPVANPTVIDASSANDGEPAIHAVIMEGISGARLDGFTISGGKATGTGSSGQGGGIYVVSADDTNTIANCMISGNRANSGGGLYLGSASPVIVSCVISGNRAISGGGLYLRDSSPSLKNLTIDRNSTTGQGGGLLVIGSSAPAIVNTIISNNLNYGVRESEATADPTLDSCLLYGNSVGEYYDENAVGYTSVSQAAMNVAEIGYLVGGDPTFTMGLSGSWESAAYDEAANTTTLQADVSDPDYYPIPTDLRGRVMIVDSAQPFGAVILASSNIQVTVAGDVSDLVQSGDGYLLADYHLLDGSRALDRGDTALAPGSDFEGEGRPGTDFLTDIGADEAPASFTPPEDTTPPETALEPVPASVSSSIISLTLLGADTGSGLDHLEIYYSKDGGPVTRYGGDFAPGQVNFDTTLTGGDGVYRIWITGVDNLGNPADSTPSGDPDAEVLVVTNFSGSVVYVNPLASGAQNGMGWDTAVRGINPAVTLAADNGAAEVWVAEGTYAETVYMASDVAVYGGFDGTETLLAQRDAEGNVTTINVSTADGGLQADHAVVFDGVSGAVLDGFTVTGGYANGDAPHNMGGGILAIDLPDATSRISGCVVSGNNADKGAGVAFSSADATVENSEVSSNQAATSGGGIYMEDGSPTLNGVTVTLNSAPDGAGIKSSSAPAALTQCEISQNVASSTGGGVSAGYSAMTVEDCIISLNQAAKGGGVMATSAAMAFTGTRIVNNLAPSGGGLALAQTNNLTMSGSVVAGNSADAGGGFWLSSSKSTLTASTVSGNTATGAGGGFNCQMYSELNLVNAMVSGNRGMNGGAVYLKGSSLSGINCTLFANAADAGGGLYLDDGASSVFKNVLFADNEEQAIYEAVADVVPTLSNCLFNGQTVSDLFSYASGPLTGAAQIEAGAAGAVNIQDGDPWLLMFGETAIFGSWTEAPVYDAESYSTTLTDSAASLVQDELVGRTIRPASNDSHEFSILSNSASQIVVAGDASSLAVSGGTYRVVDLHLTPGSEAVGAGDPGGAPTVDFEGDARPGLDGAFDIGADEAVWSGDLIAVLTGTPGTYTNMTSASITVGGVGVTEYRFKLNDGVYSAWRPVSQAINLSGLTEGYYVLSVKGRDAELSEQVYPTSASWTVDLTAPATPQVDPEANPDPVETATPTLTWQAVAGAQCYLVRLSTSPTFAAFNEYWICNGSTSLTIPAEDALIPDTMYHWEVAAVDAAGNQSDFTQGSFAYGDPSATGLNMTPVYLLLLFN